MYAFESNLRDVLANGGWGKDDFSAVTHVIEKRIGRRLSNNPPT